MKEFLEPQPMDDIEKYLQSGLQTQITPEVQRIVSDFQGTTLEKTRKILDRIASFNVETFNKNVFRKRTADQIIQDSYVTGCTDYALVFIALARALGIPAKYVETIDVSELTTGGSSIEGHVYVRIYDAEKHQWIWIDPKNGKIGADPADAERVIFQEGFDSWDIGIRDFESLKSSFIYFRKEWLSRESKPRD